MDKELVQYSRGVALRVAFYIAIAIAVLSFAGCVNYAKVERDDCRAVARGNFFTFTTPAVIEECRDQSDR